MSRFDRFTGAFALVAACAAAPLAAPFLPSFASPAPARAQDDLILFYPDPMGGPALSGKPIKDGMGMDFLPVRRSVVAPLVAKLPATPAPSSDPPLFWRDPMGGADVSTTPRKDSMGMDYLPVGAADIAGLLPPIGAAAAAKSAAPGKRRILYYRYPMGLADISPVPSSWAAASIGPIIAQAEKPGGEGTLNAIDAAKRKLNITHGPIAALNWPGMTMDFTVAPGVDIGALKPGGKVKFTLGRGADGAFVIDEINPVR